MRHRVEGRKFGRETDARRLMICNLVKSMVEHGQITTTLAKAKELRGYVERVVTYGKANTVHARRLAYSVLGNRTLVKKLFDEIAPAFADRNGGYTRVIKAGFRRGDNAPMAIIQFVEESTIKPKKDNIKAKDLNK
ncbi:MAG TPA: 50S ribosomal protein L17 [Candidatus Cloacimonadota bacterium]|jgi:large subunit ribosomal protein L17|nr:50S ribosomal protein L17 [Candidatus Cloacimonadota bacterium]OQC09634.1 MAG: 50S ribosomal protein L17 [Candidatus Cloacimonetes bacterium ADurb.Bin088]NMD12857.1 50S ribosomal protein L17 [Candidatus Cloacimonadota bacterium]HOC95556.1 50S ribosomal protein L17 [Candidatus Cloacimonadota bacterium]HOG31346.1 50S ribosomal protein L17 [Candidatus Cloacimonadota bacterium]